ncbi:hypothetical protein H5410_003587 [Solanum commersonii]|uniref:Uncharacterized protein n=1 Tax=Solanum commersonii TaxID=4109 RepID=A0A9J6B545_SOLCO|nr:hypothetical protein H5410_003587 [Solanum commersonii]
MAILEGEITNSKFRNVNKDWAARMWLIHPKFSVWSWLLPNSKVLLAFGMNYGKNKRVEGAPLLIWVPQAHPIILYALEIVVDMRSRMSLFISRLSRLSNKEGKVVMFIGSMDIALLMIYVKEFE